MDNELLNGILLSYSKLLREIEALKEDVRRISDKIHTNYVEIQTPASLPPSNTELKIKQNEEKTMKPQNKSKRTGINLLKMLEEEIE